MRTYISNEAQRNHGIDKKSYKADVQFLYQRKIEKEYAKFLQTDKLTDYSNYRINF